MRVLLRVVGVVLIGIAVLFIVVLTLGGLQPRNHVASATVTVHAPQAVVWQRIEDVDSQPTWRTGLLSVQTMPAQGGHPCWVEVQKYQKMPLCEALTNAPATRVVAMQDAMQGTKLPFGGLWTYELAPDGDGATKVTIIENGWVGPWIWRFGDHYVMHEDANIKQYEADLVKSFGQ